MSTSVVIAGAGHAAGQVVATLRQKQFDGMITLIGEEPWLPYQRPPLSKKFLAGELLAERQHGLVRDVAFSPDGTRIASVSLEDLRLWDAASGELLAIFTERDAGMYAVASNVSMNSVAFSPDGTRIVTACWDNTIRIWDGGPN